MKKFVIALLSVSAYFLFVKQIYATTDTMFTTTTLSAFGTVVVRAGNLFKLDLSGLITPIFGKPKNIATPDFKPTAEFKESISEYLTPQSLRDNTIINWDENENPIAAESLYGVILKVDAEYSNHPDPSDCYISQGNEVSDPIAFLTKELQQSEFLDAMIAINPKDADENGKLDFNRPTKHLNGMNPGEDCKKNETGLADTAIANNLNSLSTFGEGTLAQGQITQSIFDWVTKLIDNVLTRYRDFIDTTTNGKALLTLKKRVGWLQMLCHDYQCPEDETGDETINTAKTGGFTKGFLADALQKEVVAASEQAYEIALVGIKEPKTMKTTYDNVNQSRVGQKMMGCIVSPDSLQDNLTIGEGEEAIPIRPECGPSETPSVTGGWNCQTYDTEQTVNGLIKEYGQTAADGWYENCSDNDQNAWEMCNNDVIAKARSACIDPIFALAMWLHESAASSYICGKQFTGGVEVQDFGINNPEVPPEDFTQQIERFLSLDYSCPHTIKDYFASFHGFGCAADLSAEETITIDAYTASLQGIYNNLGGGDLPSWPKGQCGDQSL